MITPINGVFYLQASENQYGTQLWESNGTVAGTTLVQDMSPGAGSSYHYLMALTELNGKLIVAAEDGVYGFELLSGPMPAATGAVKPPQASRKQK